MLRIDERYLTAGPLLSDKLRTEPLIPERVRLNEDRIEWQFGASRYVPTKFQLQTLQTNGNLLTDDLVLTIHRERDLERLNDFWGLASGTEAHIKDFVGKWGPLAIFPETREPQNDDPWCEPSPEFKFLLEANKSRVQAGLIYSEPYHVYSELASFARAIVHIGEQLNYGAPVKSINNLPHEFQQATQTLNGGPAKLVFQSDADTDAEIRQDLRLQWETIYWFVNFWMQTAGVSLAIGRTGNGVTYASSWCIPNASVQKAWMAAREAGKPFTSSRWNPGTQQFQEMPIPCPSLLSGLLACDIAAILTRPSGWGVCPCGKMFRKLGRQEYCDKNCTYRRDKRRTDNRQAKRKYDANKRNKSY